jgi:hypothetical protein
MNNLREFIRKEINLVLEAEERTMRPDVQSLAKVSQSSKSLQTAQKRVNDLPEFEDAFKVWFSSLGMDNKKFTQSNIRDRVVNVLKGLGYR